MPSYPPDGTERVSAYNGHISIPAAWTRSSVPDDGGRAFRGSTDRHSATSAVLTVIATAPRSANRRGNGAAMTTLDELTALLQPDSAPRAQSSNGYPHGERRRAVRRPATAEYIYRTPPAGCTCASCAPPAKASRPITGRAANGCRLARQGGALPAARAPGGACRYRGADMRRGEGCRHGRPLRLRRDHQSRRRGQVAAGAHANISRASSASASWRTTTLPAPRTRRPFSRRCAEIVPTIGVVRFPELKPGGDLSDYFERGGTKAGLLIRIEEALQAGVAPSVHPAQPERSPAASSSAGYGAGICPSARLS